MKPTRSHRRAAAGLLACAMSALLAACGASLLPRPPAAPARYTLDSAPPGTLAVAAPTAASARTLVVAEPRAAAGYDSTRMVYLRHAQQIEAFAFHEWADPPARMLAPLLVRALQDSGAFRAVLLAPSVATGAWRLETELIRLQQDFNTQPSQLRLTLRAVLLDSATRQVIAWREFDQSVAAGSENAPAGVVAAGIATQRVLAALAAFCADQARR